MTSRRDLAAPPVVPLGPHHDRSGFAWGVEALDIYVKRRPARMRSATQGPSSSQPVRRVTCTGSTRFRWSRSSWTGSPSICLASCLDLRPFLQWDRISPGQDPWNRSPGQDLCSGAIVRRAGLRDGISPPDLSGTGSLPGRDLSIAASRSARPAGSPGPFGSDGFCPGATRIRTDRAPAPAPRARPTSHGPRDGGTPTRPAAGRRCESAPARRRGPSHDEARPCPTRASAR